MSRPAVYLHFSGKEDVFRAVARRFAHDIVARAATARLSGRPVAERLHDVLAIKIGFFTGAVEAEFRAEMFAEAGIAQERAEPAVLRTRVRQLVEPAVRGLTGRPAPTG